MSNPYEAPKFIPRERPPLERVAAVRDKPWHPLWGVCSAVVFDFVMSLVVGMTFGFVVGVILALWGMPVEEIDALVNPDKGSWPFYSSATVIGFLVSYVAGMACVNFTRGLSLDYPIYAGIITATLGAVCHREGLADLLSLQRFLIAAATIAAYSLGGLYAMRRSKLLRVKEKRVSLVTCSSSACQVQFQAQRGTCPVCGTPRT